jgi:large subunit ribosomal protein L9e
MYLDEWRPVMAMLVSNLISAVMTALVKEALKQGLNTLVLITLRQLVATLFLAPIAYFKERYLNIDSAERWINHCNNALY